MTSRKSTEQRPYVSLVEAIRVVVRLMSDGNRLAEFMTDEWIKEGYHRWQSERYDDDDPIMVSLYGPDWREWRPKTLAAYGAACGILEKVLRREKITGEGVSCAEPEKGPRAITRAEWSNRQIELRRNLLATPPEVTLTDRPAIRDVQVCVEDLKRECRPHVKALPAAICPPKSNRGVKPLTRNRIVNELLDIMRNGEDCTSRTQTYWANRLKVNCQTYREALAIATERFTVETATSNIIGDPPALPGWQ